MPRLTGFTPARLTNDDGSMPLALLAAIIVAALITVTVSTTITGQRAARFDRDFTEVLHGADAGVQQALYQLNAAPEQLEAALTAQPAPNPPRTPSYSGTIDDTDYEWYAEQTAPREWQVTSTGDLVGRDRVVIATIEERARFFPGAFGDQLVALSGTSSQIDSYNSGTCTTPAEQCRWGSTNGNSYQSLYGTGNGGLGSNEAIDVTGNPKIKHILLYDWDDNPGQGVTSTDPGGDRCNGESAGSPCIAPDTVKTIGYRLDYASDVEMSFIDDRLAACAGQDRDGDGIEDITQNKIFPNGAVLSPYDTNPVEPDPRDPAATNFYCYASVEFQGDATLDAAAMDPDSPVVIFVRDYVTIPSSGSKVNCGGASTAGVVCDKNDPRAVRPLASSLQIYSASDLDQGGGDIFIKSQSMFSGVVYAPRARCGTDGGGGGAGVDVYGSLVCGSVDNVGNWEFHFDDTLGSSGVGAYDVASWREE
ncbi:MAG: hypothetical protein M3415_08925 [Actinomycetota bacterium]|jgi:hypothetical protein|nr:hypothetical protein [Actinomycetota bacterium]